MNGERKEQEYKFVIIKFEDNAIEVIHLDWAKLDDNGDVIATFFPPVKNAKMFREMLANNSKPNETWTDNGLLWSVKKTYRFFGT